MDAMAVQVSRGEANNLVLNIRKFQTYEGHEDVSVTEDSCREDTSKEDLVNEMLKASVIVRNYVKCPKWDVEKYTQGYDRNQCLSQKLLELTAGQELQFCEFKLSRSVGCLVKSSTRNVLCFNVCTYFHDTLTPYQVGNLTRQVFLLYHTIFSSSLGNC